VTEREVINKLYGKLGLIDIPIIETDQERDIIWKALNLYSMRYENVLIDKQIPKMIKEIHCDEYYCPTCGSENICDQYKVYDKYCPQCGQALLKNEETEWKY